MYDSLFSNTASKSLIMLYTLFSEDKKQVGKNIINLFRENLLSITEHFWNFFDIIMFYILINQSIEKLSYLIAENDKSIFCYK